MTPPMQDDLAAGRELDAEVATKVMRWQNAGERFDLQWGAEGPMWSADGRHGWMRLPEFSTDIGAAWQIVEWAEASPRGWKLTLIRSGRSLPDYVWICIFHRGHVQLARVVEREAPLAICKAALQAVSA